MNSNPTKQISAGELAVGQMVTILEWIPRESPSFDGGLFGGVATVTHRDFSWCGDTLRVEAIDLPYVAVSHPNDSWQTTNTRLDTRRVKLMELKPEYVAAMKRRATP